MSDTQESINHVLVVDDTDSILADFRKILEDSSRQSSLASAKASLFGTAGDNKPADCAFKVDTATHGQQALAMLEETMRSGGSYCMAFVDMRMPNGWDGLETIRRLWECDSRLQVVLCTAYSDYSLDQITEQLGPGDRLLVLKKPFDSVEVLQMAQTLAEKWRLGRQAELKMSQLEHMVQERTAEIQYMSLHDKLTGLPNRALLMERLSVCFDRRKRHSDYRFGMLFLDFDRFKIVNDSLGHEAGDILLTTIAQRLRDSLRSGDLVSCGDSMPARLGGDEFIVLLDDLRDEPDAARVAERLLGVLQAPYDIKGQPVHTTVSIGITTSKCNYDNPSAMLRDADTAMYRAKAAGRSRYVMFDQRMHEQAATRLSLEVELRHAVANDQFVVHYQPIVHPDNGLTGFEALVRWQHPQRGLIAPDAFIPVAEEIGLILRLDFMVIQEACRQLKKWQDEYPQVPLTMSANLSRKHLTDPGLAGRIQRIIEDNDVRPNSFCLEITETAVMEDAAMAAETIEHIKDAGIRLYLDDFGTGQTSLSCLHQLALGGLKIDRSLVRDLTTRKELETILKAILEVARAFNMDVIAEGVETPEQASLLDKLSCGKLQGYLFSKPMNAPDAEEYIRQFLRNAGRKPLRIPA